MNKKWVAIGGYSPSVMGYDPARFAKDITLRYNLHSSVSGSAVRIKFSNWTGKTPITLSDITLGKIIGGGLKVDSGSLVRLTFGGKNSVTIAAGAEAFSDEAEFSLAAGENFAVSYYLPDFTEMSAGVNQSGGFVCGRFSQGNRSFESELPVDLTCDTGNCYFIETVEVKAAASAKATVLFGDSITAMAWPDYLAQRFEAVGIERSVIRRGVSGSRVLREYSCTTYAGYGLKGERRFAREIDVAGADSVIILHGVNDLIHPDGSSVFRPIEHFPSVQEMIDGFKFYIKTAKDKGIRVYLCTIMPFGGWRTYEPFHEEVRIAVNEWIKNEAEADGVVDLALALANPEDTSFLLPQFDSGDHLHPSDAGSHKMADTVNLEFFK
jgi:lysophospholipase L1-like esterase